VDARDRDRLGGGVDVFGLTDLLIRSETDFERHVDQLVSARLGAEGIETVDDHGASPSVQVEIVSIALRRDPGLVTARYTGTADLLVSVLSDQRTLQRQVIGKTEREASGLRALEESVLNALLTETLDVAATTAAREIAAMVRESPPQQLR
jgi:hypothetical protein